MSSLHNRFRLLGFLLAATLLAACGGGGSDPSTPPPPPPPPGGGAGGSSAAYLFYAGSLHAVDPTAPASPLTVEAGSDINTGTGRFGAGSSAQKIIAGTYDGAAQTITGLHAHALMYAKTNGKLYRVSALKSGSLIPVQVSSESGADKLCPIVESRMDLANPDNSPYVYSLPGSDSMCGTGDDVWKMVRLGMSASAAPVAAKPPVDSINNANTGAIAGWLVKGTGGLERCDANFANCSVVANTLQALVLDYIGSDRLVMNINGQIVVYNGANNTLSLSVFAMPAGQFVSGMENDGTAVYFVHGKSVYRFPADGSAVATPLITEVVDIGGMGLTANKVVYQVGNEIKAVSKTGGTPSTLATATGSDVLNLSFTGGVAGNNYYVYYSISNSSGKAAGVVDENGGGRSSTPNAAWIGVVLPTTISNAGFTVSKVIRAEGGTNNGFGGATLKSFNAATAVEVATLGTLSATDNWTSFDCFENSFSGDNLLCTATLNTSVQSDIFFINAAAANSLTRVTNTPDKSETHMFD